MRRVHLGVQQTDELPRPTGYYQLRCPSVRDAPYSAPHMSKRESPYSPRARHTPAHAGSKRRRYPARAASRGRRFGRYPGFVCPDPYKPDKHDDHPQSFRTGGLPDHGGWSVCRSSRLLDTGSDCCLPIMPSAYGARHTSTNIFWQLWSDSVYTLQTAIEDAAAAFYRHGLLAPPSATSSVLQSPYNAQLCWLWLFFNQTEVPALENRQVR